MAWDGSGNFTRTNGTQTGSVTWADARDAANNILASQHDTHDQDLADGIAACLTKNNETKPTVNFKPNTDNSIDLGSSTLQWRRAYIAGYIGDTNANEMLKFSATSSAVNEITIANAATGNGPTISATGGDTDVALNINPKGTGALRTSAGSIKLTAANLVQITANTSDASDTTIVDICGGGSVSTSRGAFVSVSGNEAGGSTGVALLHSGDVAGALIQLASGTSTIRLNRNAGVEINTTAYIGDTANASATLGLTINQGAADDEIISLKSSDVAHGVTGVTETDTYGFMTKISATAGGLELVGVRETGGAPGIRLRGFADTPDTAAGTSAVAVVMMQAQSFSGTGLADHAANALVFGVQGRVGGANRSLFFVDEDGDFFADGAAGAAFDSWDDLALVRAFDRERVPHQVIRSEFDDFVKYNRADLVRAGILTSPKEGDPMVNVTQLQRLHNGAIWQLGAKLMAAVNRLDAMEKRLLN